MNRTLRIFALFWGLFLTPAVWAQEAPLNFATVERAPFAILNDGVPSGFSVELMQDIAEHMGREITFDFFDDFPAMLAALDSGEHDGAVANISITADRELTLDFTHPIFDGGIGVLLLDDDSGGSFLSALFTQNVLYVGLAALGLLFGCGVMMWWLERRSQAYFDRKGGDAMFHSFWWSLNLVVNGGFEERVPQTPAGRMLAISMVVMSLFVVSAFVATITSTMTIEALQDNIASINDLEGRRVATIDQSTSAAFLDARDLSYVAYNSPAEMFTELEAGGLDAIVFDAPILSYYSNILKEPETRLLPRIYRRESYGIALPTGSTLIEEINQTLLRLREDGSYGALVTTWFGASDS